MNCDFENWDFSKISKFRFLVTFGIIDLYRFFSIIPNIITRHFGRKFVTFFLSKENLSLGRIWEMSCQADVTFFSSKERIWCPAKCYFFFK